MRRIIRQWGARMLAVFALCIGSFVAIGASPVYAYGPTGEDVTIPSISVSPEGEVTVSIAGSGFEPNDDLSLEVHSAGINVGTVIANSAGSFSTSVILPAGLPAGPHTLTTSGEAASDATSVNFTLAAVTTAGPTTSISTPSSPSGLTSTPSSGLTSTPSSGVTSSPSGLAFTGANVVGTVSAAAVAIALGGMLLLFSRRRRHSDWAQ